MTTIDRRLFDLDRMGIDIQVVAPAPGQCYYYVDPKIAESAHRITNDGVAEFCMRKPDRFLGLGGVTLQGPDLAVRELDYVMSELKLKGVQILTNVDGKELSDPLYRPFFARAEQLGALIMLHPNGFTHGERFTHFYFNNVIGNPLETTFALHNLIFSGAYRYTSAGGYQDLGVHPGFPIVAINVTWRWTDGRWPYLKVSRHSAPLDRAFRWTQRPGLVRAVLYDEASLLCERRELRRLPDCWSERWRDRLPRGHVDLHTRQRRSE